MTTPVNTYIHFMFKSSKRDIQIFKYVYHILIYFYKKDKINILE